MSDEREGCRITDDFCIHGVRLVVASEDARAASAVRELLRPYHRPSPARVDSGAWSPVCIHLKQDTAAEPTGPVYPTEAPLLTYDAVRGYARADAIALTDGFSWVEVMAGGQEIRARLSERTLADPYQFAALLFNVALQVCLRAHGLYYTHAAAVVTPGGQTVMLTGNSGAGKSTLAVSLALAGWTFISDDALFLRGGSRGPEALALRRPIHLDQGALEAFPVLRRAADGPHRRGSRVRWDVSPTCVFGSAVAERAGAPALLVLIDRSANENSELRSVGPSVALDCLMRQSGLVMLGGPSTRDHLETLAKVVRGSTHCALSVGIDILGDPARAADLVRAALDSS